MYFCILRFSARRLHSYFSALGRVRNLHFKLSAPPFHPSAPQDFHFRVSVWATMIILSNRDLSCSNGDRVRFDSKVGLEII